MGLVSDTRAIGADWKFVKEEFQIAMMLVDPLTIMQAAIFGTMLGALALPKTIIGLATPSINNVIMWYGVSSVEVTNSPGKTGNYA